MKTLARGQIHNLGSGWFRCQVLDMFGGLIEDLGREKGKTKAQQKANRAALEYNRTHQPAEETGSAWERRSLRNPIVIPKGEQSEGLNT